MEIWTGVTDASLTHSQRRDRATQLLIKYKSGALVTQFIEMDICVLSKCGKKINVYAFDQYLDVNI